MLAQNEQALRKSMDTDSYMMMYRKSIVEKIKAIGVLSEAEEYVLQRVMYGEPVSFAALEIFENMV